MEKPNDVENHSDLQKPQTERQKLSRNNIVLSTPIGKFLDRTSYKSLAIAIILIIGITSLYYWIANSYDQGTNNESISFWESVYFSIITLSSLGYGDIAPKGFGRFIASLEVLLGVVSISLFVGKIASERQSTMLLLLLTSDNQRRISEFIDNINTLSDSIDTAGIEHEQKNLIFYCKQSARLIASLQNYLVFQANQGGLTSFGNESSLRTLYKAITEIQESLYAAAKLAETKEEARTWIERGMERTSSIARVMSNFHDDPKSLSRLTYIQTFRNDYSNWETSRKKGIAKLLFNTQMTEALLERVLAELPPLPWSKNIHKDVAEKLGISNRMAHRCISELLNRGYLSNNK